MALRCIRNVCEDPKRSDAQKVQLILHIVDTIRDFQTLVDSRPRADEAALAEEFRLERNLREFSPQEQAARTAIANGVRAVLATRRADGGWGFVEERRLDPLVWNLLSAVSPSPTERSLTWDTALAVLALQDVTRFGSAPTNEDRRSVADALNDGLRWLIAAQNATDGGWSELGGSTPAVPSHCIETGVTLWALGPAIVAAPTTGGVVPDAAAINRGLAFIDRLQRQDGGVASREVDTESDVKPTAMSAIINYVFRPNASDVAARNIDWLLANQTRDGHWGRTPAGHFINPAFYAMSALLLHYERKHDAAVLPGIRLGVSWYQNQVGFVEKGGTRGWAWSTIENTASAVAALLNSDEPELSTSIQGGVDWLLQQESKGWGAETPIAMIALTRYLYPNSRMLQRTRQFYTGQD